MTQGERIKEARKSMQLTLEDFGKKLGVSKGAISAIENGTRNLTDQMAVSICRTYNVDYDWLMTGEGEMFTDVPQTILEELCKQYELDDMDKAMVELYINLPEEFRTYLKQELHSMIEKVGRWEDKK